MSTKKRLIPSVAGKGQYTKKYHFEHYVPKFGSWGLEQMTPELQASVNALTPEDRDRVGALFGGEQTKPEKKSKKKAPKKKKKDEDDEEEEEEVGDDEDEDDAPKKKKKKAKAKKD